jgi:hypothetical protein
MQTSDLARVNRVWMMSEPDVLPYVHPAAQRAALVPISRHITAHHGGNTSGLRLLEVAAGTGRFHTFIKVPACCVLRAACCVLLAASLWRCAPAACPQRFVPFVCY